MQISPANWYLHATVWPQTVTCKYHLALPKRNVTSQGLLDIEFPFISYYYHGYRYSISRGRTISACHGLRSDRGMQISVGRWYLHVLNSEKKSEIHKSWRWISEHMLACHGLTSDQDMQGVLEFWVAGPKFPKVLCMPRSDLRPGHARGFGILGLPTLDSQKYFACHGLTSDQHMQGVWEFWGYLPQIPKSTLHATVWPQTRTCKGSWNFAGLVASVLVNMCQQNIPWRIDNSYRQLVF